MISIVMPVYNGEKYLRKSIESIMGQTYEDWELIMVDDCSTDMSYSIMMEYHDDNRVKIVRNAKNLKLPKSLNVGFENAQGEYWSWTSDDNEYKKDAFMTMLDYLACNEKVGMVYADMDYIDGIGDYIGDFKSDINMLYNRNCIGACFLYRKAVADMVGKYDDKRFLVEDYDYWLRIAQISTIEHISSSLYRYRKHENSLTEKREMDVNLQLFKLRRDYVDFLSSKMNNQQKNALFYSMYMIDEELGNYLNDKIFNDGLNHRVVRESITVSPGDRIVLFGAGEYGRKALRFYGDRVEYIIDNNPNKIGNKMDGVQIVSLDGFIQLSNRDRYTIVISVGDEWVSQIVDQVENVGIKKYTFYLTELYKTYSVHKIV